MAPFPDFPVSPRSAIDPDAGLRTRITEGGGIRGRRAFDSPVYSLTVIYELLEPAEREQLDTFYTDNRDNLNQISIDGQDYEVRFINKPMPVEYLGLNRTMNVQLIGKAL